MVTHSKPIALAYKLDCSVFAPAHHLLEDRAKY